MLLCSKTKRCCPHCCPHCLHVYTSVTPVYSRAPCKPPEVAPRAGATGETTRCDLFANKRRKILFKYTFGPIVLPLTVWESRNAIPTYLPQNDWCSYKTTVAAVKVHSTAAGTSYKSFRACPEPKYPRNYVFACGKTCCAILIACCTKLQHAVGVC